MLDVFAVNRFSYQLSPYKILKTDFKAWFEFTAGPNSADDCRGDNFQLFEQDCRTALTSTDRPKIPSDLTIEMYEPTNAKFFCLKEMTLGYVSTGRVIQFEVCGAPIYTVINPQVFTYPIDKSPNPSLIHAAEYSDWFIPSSPRCPIVSYKVRVNNKDDFDNHRA